MIEIAGGDVNEADKIGGVRVPHGVVEVEKWATMVVIWRWRAVDLWLH